MIKYLALPCTVSSVFGYVFVSYNSTERQHNVVNNFDPVLKVRGPSTSWAGRRMFVEAVDQCDQIEYNFAVLGNFQNFSIYIWTLPKSFGSLCDSLSLYKVPKAKELGNITLKVSKYLVGLHSGQFWSHCRRRM